MEEGLVCKLFIDGVAHEIIENHEEADKTSGGEVCFGGNSTDELIDSAGEF